MNGVPYQHGILGSMAGCECMPHCMDLKMHPWKYPKSYVFSSIASTDGCQYIILDVVALCIALRASDPSGYQMNNGHPIPKGHQMNGRCLYCRFFMDQRCEDISGEI